MDSATTEFLQVNGVFTLPSESLQNALLQSFVECVLPSMPIVEWQDFLNSIYGRSGHSPISLLLFHAVMFSAITFVDLKHLNEAGYSNRREAHESFFQKAKVSQGAVTQLELSTNKKTASLPSMLRRRHPHHRAIYAPPNLPR